MKLIWNPGVTLDGNIATADGNSDWPTDASGKLCPVPQNLDHTN